MRARSRRRCSSPRGIETARSLRRGAWSSITAAWAEEEHNEAHVKATLNEIGLESQYEDGFDRTLVTLSLVHELHDLFQKAPELDDAWRELRRIVNAARSLYLVHNAHLIALFRRALRA